MKKKRIFIFIIVSVICSVLIIQILEKHEKRKKKNNEFSEVLVASRNIKQYHFITTNDVRIKKIPFKYIQPSCFISKQALITNQKPRFYAKIDIRTNTQLTSSLIERDENSSLDLIIPKGMRAVSIEIPDKRFLQLLFPGEKIDFIINLFDKTLFLIQNVMIIQKGPMNIKNTALFEKIKNSVQGKIIVLLSEKDVLRYHYMIHSSDVDIVARSRQDDKIVESCVIKKADIMQGDFKHNHRVEILKGLKKRTKFNKTQSPQNLDKMLILQYQNLMKNNRTKHIIAQQKQRYKRNKMKIRSK